MREIFLLKEVSLLNLILIGHGVKIFGHAILDELAILLFMFRKPSRTFHVKWLLTCISSLIFISTIYSIMKFGYANGYHLKTLLISISLFLLNFISTSSIRVENFIFGSWLYVLVNASFLAIEQTSIIMSENGYFCYVDKSCLLEVAFWQQFWSGTAYSAIGLFFSVYCLIVTANKLLVKQALFGLFLVLVGYQKTRFGVFLAIPLSVSTISGSLLRGTVLLFFMLMAVILVDILFYTFMTRTSFAERAHEFINLGYFEQSLVISTLLDLFRFFQNIDLSTFGAYGRQAQLMGTWNYLVSADMFELILGNGTGAHRTGAAAFIALDSSGILRPIGIFAWIFDWGLFLVLIYLALVFSQIVNVFRCQNGVRAIVPVAMIFVVATSPLVTNVTESLLFWILISNSSIFCSSHSRNYNGSQ